MGNFENRPDYWSKFVEFDGIFLVFPEVIFDRDFRSYFRFK